MISRACSARRRKRFSRDSSSPAWRARWASYRRSMAANIAPVTATKAQPLSVETVTSVPGSLMRAPSTRSLRAIQRTAVRIYPSTMVPAESSARRPPWRFTLCELLRTVTTSLWWAQSGYPQGTRSTRGSRGHWRATRARSQSGRRHDATGRACRSGDRRSTREISRIHDGPSQSLALRLVHGGIGACNQRIGGDRPVAGEGDPEARLHIERSAREMDWSTEGAADPLGDVSSGRNAADPRTDDKELVPADPPERVIRADGDGQAVSDNPQ